MQEIFNKYIDYLEAERNASPYTVRNYSNDLIEFLNFVREKKVSSLEEVNRQILRDFLARLSEKGIFKTSIARKLSAIRSFYRYLVREEILSSNPLKGTSSPKLDKRLPSFLTLGEVGQLLSAPNLSTPKGRRDRALVELIYASGLRVGELVKIDLGDIDLDAKEIRVLGKGSKERVVLIGKQAQAALISYLNEARPKLLGGKKTKALFLNRDGERILKRRVQKIIEEYAKLAGIEKGVHPHMLRHTFATHLLDGGADLRVVQELLGHSSLSSTQVYTHVTKSQVKKIYLKAHPMAEKEGDEPENSRPT